MAEMLDIQKEPSHLPELQAAALTLRIDREITQRRAATEFLRC